MANWLAEGMLNPGGSVFVNPDMHQMYAIVGSVLLEIYVQWSCWMILAVKT